MKTFLGYLLMAPLLGVLLWGIGYLLYTQPSFSLFFFGAAVVWGSFMAGVFLLDSEYKPASRNSRKKSR